ncbi:hypothetical protein C2I36_14605 [Rhodobacteraceae bacterium WD3A24]|nr:hypothetical protein C2I36_14605 [Rhodobacteraceae bacterium WD3A24]
MTHHHTATGLRPAVGALALTALMASTTVAQADWTDDYDEVRLGTAASEVDDDTVNAFNALAEYLTERFGVTFSVRQATDYAAVIEALRNDQLEFTRMGGATYALASRIMGDGVEPMVLDEVNGGRGYHSVVLARADSGYEDVADLAGESLAFVDPNSASGYVAPNFFLTQEGYEPEDHFDEIVFAGSHDNAVIGLINGQYEAAATFQFTPENSAVTRLAERDMIEPDAVRTLWVSPLLANPLWAARTDLPEEMRADFVEALVELPEADPEAWEVVRQGRLSAYAPTTHEEYQPMIDMTEWTREQRRGD